MNLDVLQPHRKAISYCAACPKMCRFACPVTLASGREADTPTAKAHVLQQVMAGRLPVTVETARAFYRCAECLHERTHCEHRIEPAGHFQAARVLAVRAGVEPPGVRKVDQAMLAKGNPFGLDLKSVIDELIPARLRAAGSGVAYFPGCVSLAREPGIVRATIRVLESLKIAFSVYAPANGCCGYPALAGGYPETFRAQARWHQQALARYSTVITSCPSCAHTFETRYPELGFPLAPRIAHVTEFLADRVAWVQRSHAEVKPAVYHDPCFLGRYRGTYEPPRQLLGQALGEAAGEFVRNRRDGGCCGAGGLLPHSFPDAAAEIGRTRLREAAALGARTLVTACPSCRHWLGKLGGEVEVWDVMEVVGAEGGR